MNVRALHEALARQGLPIVGITAAGKKEDHSPDHPENVLWVKNVRVDFSEPPTDAQVRSVRAIIRGWADPPSEPSPEEDLLSVVDEILTSLPPASQQRLAEVRLRLAKRAGSREGA